MNLKKLFISLATCLTILSFTTTTSAEVLIGKDYYEALHERLSQAKTSITVAMYFIILDPQDETSPINVLVDDLISAKKRGVEVKVILEDSKLNASKLAYEKLKENNVPVYFDKPNRLLHIKGVAIDDRYVFLGSANWSRSAIEENYEASLFVDSTDDAISFKQYIESIIEHSKTEPLSEIKGVTIPAGFLLSRDGGSQLIRSRSPKQFDLYLLLCKIQHEGGKAELVIDYDSLAKEMRYTFPGKTKRYYSDHAYYYDVIHHLLDRLKLRGLIDYKNGVVSLNTKHLEMSDLPLMTIPYEYWEYDYPNRLSARAKYMYLVCLYETAVSSPSPYWFHSQEYMSKLYGISETVVSRGLLEIEEKGIIEVTRSKKIPPDFSDRKANVYRMLPLKR